jgi:pyruvate/2-oxoglutarate dehydrogenase complex dihydrolipoamide acyltransferase (E2) component
MVTTVLAPQINSNDDNVEVVAWHVENGAYVEAGQDVAELETSKATVTLAADSAGYIECLLPARTLVRVGAPIFRIAASRAELNGAGVDRPVAPDGAGAAAAARELGAPVDGTTPAGRYSATRFSRAAVQLLKRRGMSPDSFAGAGLVTARSLEKLLGLDGAPPVHGKSGATALAGSASETRSPRAPRCERLSPAKQAEIQALSLGESGNINSMLSVGFDSAPIRARLRQERLFDGNVLPLALYELSRLLGNWPQFTACYRDGEIHYYDRIDLGVAIDLGKGLKVVTIGNATDLSPADFFARTLDIGMRYLENRLRPDELTGSTLTITDLSGLDILHFHPLINGAQSAIIGLGGDKTRVGHPMTINMTFDHRVAGGRDVAAFLTELRARLLSYASSSLAAAGEERSELGANGRDGATWSSAVCDRCGVDARSYYCGFERDGYMLAYYRADGSLGRVCHRCYDRWN